MKITVDVGNTTTAFGFFDGTNLVKVVTLETEPRRTFDQTLVHVTQMFDYEKLLSLKITDSIIASVVPIETSKMQRLIKALYGVEALVLGPGLKTGLALKVDNPNEVGADLVAVSVGALLEHQAPFILVDLGTVNKYILIDDKAQFAGVSFTAGLMMSKDALDKDTALLMQVSLEKPKYVIGKNTKDALNSGLIYGTIAQINGMIALISQEVGANLPVIITGGNASYIQEDVSSVTNHPVFYHPTLIHVGLHAILLKNKRGK